MRYFYIILLLSICCINCSILPSNDKTDGKIKLINEDKIEQKGFTNDSFLEDSVTTRTLLNIKLYNPESISIVNDSLIIEEYLVTMKYTLYWKFSKKRGWFLYNVDKNVGGAHNSYIFPASSGINGKKLTLTIKVIDNWEETRIQELYPMNFLISTDTTRFNQPSLIIDKTKGGLKNHSDFLEGLIRANKVNKTNNLIEILQKNVGMKINVYFEHVRK